VDHRPGWQEQDSRLAVAKNLIKDLDALTLDVTIAIW
jgi:hypothetical protein